MVGAVPPASGPLAYIAPAFEEGTIRDFREVDGVIHGWQEHESPYRLLLDLFAEMGVAADAVVGLCPSLAFFMFEAIRRLGSDLTFVDASCVINPCRYHKSADRTGADAARQRHDLARVRASPPASCAQASAPPRLPSSSARRTALSARRVRPSASCCSARPAPSPWGEARAGAQGR